MTQEALTTEIDQEQIDHFFENHGEIDGLPAQDSTQDEEGREAEPPETREEDIAEPKESQANEIDRNLKAALSEERNIRKELQREKQDLLTQKQKMEEAFQRFLESQQPKVQEPSYEDDPLEALRYKTQQHELAVQQLYQNELQKQQQAEYQSRQHAFMEQYTESARTFSKENPDFNEAYQHLVQSRINEYKHAGYNEQEAKRLLIEDELAIASKSFQEGINPAERMYALAKVRGYTPQQNNKKLENIAKSVQASKSLSNASGKTYKSFSLESLAHLSQEELNDVIQNQWDKVTGAMQ